MLAEDTVSSQGSVRGGFTFGLSWLLAGNFAVCWTKGLSVLLALGQRPLRFFATWASPTWLLLYQNQQKRASPIKTVP